MRPTSLRLTVAACAYCAALLPACGKSGTISVATNPDALAAAKDGSGCPAPAKVLAGVEYTCADGKKRKGILTASNVPLCKEDGEKGCLANDSHPAVTLSKLAPGNLKQGITIAGVAGTLTAGGPADCASDGEIDCVASSSFPAANATGLASKVISTASVAGVAGNVTLPVTASVLSTVTFGAGGATPGTLGACSAISRTGCYAGIGWTGVETAQLVAGVVKNGTSLGGVTGEYPSATYPLPGASGTDLPSLAASVGAGSYQFWKQDGSRVTGSISDAGTVTPGATAQSFTASLYRQFSVSGDAALVAGNIKSGATIFSVVGNVTLPATTDVKSAVSYGVAGTGSTGSYTGAPACTADGGRNCNIPASGSIVAADTTNFTGWDVRKKRNSGGTVLTFAGLAGQSKTCRNRANTTIWNNIPTGMVPDHSPLSSAGLDLFDTIDDNNSIVTGLPGEIPAWTMLIDGSTVTAGNDFKCGGIYATGDTATGNTGADADILHDANGNWQDLTPNYAPGGSASDNLGGSNGCNHSGKHCVFKELISGLMVTEVSGATYNWTNAIGYCHALGEAGGAITSPIPVIGGSSYSDWRLPTQKELMQIYHGGVAGLNQTANLTTLFGNVNSGFWSSSADSDDDFVAWLAYLHSGYMDVDGKSSAYRAVCVR